MTAVLVHAETCDLDEDCTCDPAPANQRETPSRTANKQRRDCTVADCTLPADLTLERHASLPSGRYCRKHHQQADRWLAEERRLDHIEDGRRDWLLEWENGWDGTHGSPLDDWKWDDVGDD
jgi:hypothetical protein